MARPKPWISRIPQIIKAVESGEASSFRRSDVEVLFSIGRSAAGELMRVAGAKGETLSRANLLNYLRYSPEAQAAEQEARRKANLAKKLKEAEQDQRFRRLVIDPAPGYEWVRLRDLVNVSIEPGRIIVAASDGEDALHQLWLLSRAIGNDYDGFCEALKRERIPAGMTPEQAGQQWYEEVTEQEDTAA